MQTFLEHIRLVVWDLDETFWKGTLEEGDVVIEEDVKRIVPELARRGIISSICSKNNLDAVRERLERDGLWGWFVFPRVAYAMKADLVADIIEQMGLRPPTVLFIDDNAFNRGEVVHRIADINAASELIIPSLLSHPQLQGKPDLDLSRLQRYRVLQQKQTELRQASDPGQYLRSCEIKLSFHYDIAEQFDRVHDLVNRTNQLNFTKRRWDEDPVEALGQFGQESGGWGSHFGYVKVADRFGYYGICGFFLLNPPHLTHFLFSCRVLNMGVEQFVFQNLNFPWIDIEGACAATLERTSTVDWIEVVDDAEKRDQPGQSQARPKMTLRGPCELAQVVHYLRTRFDVEEEFGFPRAGWTIQRYASRLIGLAKEMDALGLQSNADLDLPADFGGFDVGLLSTSCLTDDCDVRVLCFSAEPDVSQYRHDRTGLVVPLILHDYFYRDFIPVATETLCEQIPDANPDHIEAVKRHYTYAHNFDRQSFAADLAVASAEFERSGKPVIVVEGFDDGDLLAHPVYRRNGEVNAEARRTLAHLPFVRFVSLADCVTSADQEVEPNHFRREVYMRLAERIEKALATFDPVSSDQPVLATVD